jgi:NADPH-dependent 2,4-dienoyl-CoA reductase/sulfur reductase-like enzyme
VTGSSTLPAPTRRTVVAGLAAAAALPAAPALAQGARPKAVVVGGGFGGATCARALHRMGVAVTLVEPSETYVSCPMSNAVIAGLRDPEAQRFGYEALRREGIAVVHRAATSVDPGARRVALAAGESLPFDRLVLSPGIDLHFDALPGYDEAAADRMPHAWKAGPQTSLLRRQLQALPDGGVVVMTIPANPYRCPPGPYERASLIAHYLKTSRPRSKLIVLDAKDQFSKQRLFEAAWGELYPGLLEYVPLSGGGRAVSVEPEILSVETEFGAHRGDVVNVIPPQRAGRIALQAGVADRTGWCPVDPTTFESRLVPGIHVIGDAAIMGAMPKSAFAANAQGKACAAAVASLLRGESPPPLKLINTCYSLVAPGYGISVAGVYHPSEGRLVEVEGSGGTSPLDAPPAARALEADYAAAWFDVTAAEVFG